MTAGPGFQPPRPVDPAALSRAAERVARAPEPPWLHTEVGRRMAQRLLLIKLQPPRVARWWPLPGDDLSALREAYPRAEVFDVQPPFMAPQRVNKARNWLSWVGRKAPQALPEEQVSAGSADLVWSNMGLHAALDPQAVISAWHRALAIDGFLMFSTLGPGSLPELRSLYAEEGWGPPMAPLVDMHDLGDMLVHAGFADPVMDQEELVLTWRDAHSALAELRTLGANADPRRHPGLRTPGWRARLLQRLEQLASQRADGRVALRLEVAYGHAFRPPARARVAPQTTIAVEDLRAQARAHRGHAPR